MVYNSAELLDSLAAEIERIADTAGQLARLDHAMLAAQPAAGKWSVVQVLEHLNSYNRYYLPQIEAALAKAPAGGKVGTFKPGWLGNYFTQSMYSTIPTTGTVSNGMQSPKDHRPIADLNPKVVLDEFISGLATIQQLIQRSRSINIAKARVPISIAKWVRISLGDTLRFLIAHKVRHFVQIRNTLALVQR